MSIRSQDLNLLQIFEAIMSEQSVTQAAKKLSITQPAVSNAIARMRELWSDPVFVKTGRSIKPTAFSKSLWQQIKGPLMELSNAVNFKAFEPATSQREFRISVSDFFVDIAWLPLIKELEKYAPGMNVYASPHSIYESARHLKEAQVDFVVGPISETDRSFRSECLGKGDLVLALRKGHPLAKHTSITIEDFVAANHLLVTSTYNATGVVDQALKDLGLKRRVSVTVNHFSSAPELLKSTDLLVSIPRVVSRTQDYQDDLVFYEHPLDLGTFTIDLSWHNRNDLDAEVQWFKDLFVRVIKEQCCQCDKFKMMNKVMYNNDILSLKSA